MKNKLQKKQEKESVELSRKSQTKLVDWMAYQELLRIEKEKLKEETEGGKSRIVEIESKINFLR